MEIKCMKNGFKMQDAFERLYKRSKHFTIEKMEKIHYCRYEWYDGAEAQYFY